jgi:hypothetical protein
MFSAGRGGCERRAIGASRPQPLQDANHVAYESTNLETTSTMTDGTSVDLDRQDAKLFVLGLGGTY